MIRLSYSDIRWLCDTKTFLFSNVTQNWQVRQHSISHDHHLIIQLRILCFYRLQDCFFLIIWSTIRKKDDNLFPGRTAYARCAFEQIEGFNECFTIISASYEQKKKKLVGRLPASNARQFNPIDKFSLYLSSGGRRLVFKNVLHGDFP